MRDFAVSLPNLHLDSRFAHPDPGLGARSVGAARGAGHPPTTYTPAGGYAAVAKTTTPSRPLVFTGDPHLHLLRRATFGARPSDVADLNRLGVDVWLSRQLTPEVIDDAPGQAALALFPLASATPSRVRAAIPAFAWDAMRDTAIATLARQIFSNRQLYEQVVDVMTDLLHVPIPSTCWDTAPSWINDVIRPHAMGRYRDLLKAAMRHPALLVALDADRSTRVLVNENLGRELLELHTVGLAAGYTEADVVASARVLTGRSTYNGAFEYHSWDHWTGPVKVLGWSDPNATTAGGLAVGDSYLDYLAGHQNTALTVATRLAVRFVCDHPPQALVERLARAYLDHDTLIAAVLDELFRSPEFWASAGQRTRRPLEDTVGTARVLDLHFGADPAKAIMSLYSVLGQTGAAPLAWQAPNGYPDVAEAWDNAGSLVNRWTMHRALVNGWWGGDGQVPPDRLVNISAGMTAGQWVDALSLRLLGQPLSAAHRAVILAFSGFGANDTATQAARSAWGLVPLFFDGPYFQLR